MSRNRLLIYDGNGRLVRLTRKTVAALITELVPIVIEQGVRLAGAKDMIVVDYTRPPFNLSLTRHPANRFFPERVVLDIWKGNKLFSGEWTGGDDLRIISMQPIADWVPELFETFSLPEKIIRQIGSKE